MSGRRWVFLPLSIAAVVVVQGCLLSMVDVPAAAAATHPSSPAPLEAPGPSAVGVRELALGTEATRVWCWYPAAPRAPSAPVTYPYEIQIADALGPNTIGEFTGRAVREAPMSSAPGASPVVVLEPGYAIGARAYAWLGEHLASHGFVVVAPARAGALADAEEALWRAAVSRPRALNTLLVDLEAFSQSSDPLASRLDTGRVAVVGHSVGGYAAMVAGGARLDPQGFEKRCQDERATEGDGAWLCDAMLPHVDDMAAVASLPSTPEGLWPSWASPSVRAVVSLAGDAYLLDKAGLAELTVPVLAIGGTADVDTPYDWGTAPTFEHAAAHRRARATLNDAGHMVFTARCTAIRRLMTMVPSSFCADDDGRRVQRQRFVAGLTTAFLMAELSADTAAIQLLVERARRGGDPSVALRGYEVAR